MKRKKGLFYIICAVIAVVAVNNSGTTQIKQANAETIYPLCKLSSSRKTKTVKVVPIIENTHFSYDKRKGLKLVGKAKGLSKVELLYNGKKLKTVNVKQNGKFTTNINFKGYGDITLFGINEDGKKATPIKKVTRVDYAALKPFAVIAKRTKKSLIYNLKTEKGCRLNFYYKGKKFYAVKAKSEKTTVVFPENKVKGKTGFFIIQQQKAGKKTSPAGQAIIPKIGETIELYVSY